VHSTAEHRSRAQHGTAQHCTAQHCTALHSAAQRSRAEQTAAQRSRAQRSPVQSGSFLVCCAAALDSDICCATCVYDLCARTPQAVEAIRTAAASNAREGTKITAWLKEQAEAQ
jgi:hypothetical protein